MPFFQSSQHLACKTWLDEDPDHHLVAVLLRGSGHTEFFSQLEEWKPTALVGRDADDAFVALSPEEVVGYYMLDRAALPSAVLGAVDVTDQGTSPDLAAWQAALDELRAAAGKSKDEAVKAAVAKLAAVENG